jgi:hypothetical protein
MSRRAAELASWRAAFDRRGKFPLPLFVYAAARQFGASTVSTRTSLAPGSLICCAMSLTCAFAIK